MKHPIRLEPQGLEFELDVHPQTNIAYRGVVYRLRSIEGAVKVFEASQSVITVIGDDVSATGTRAPSSEELKRLYLKAARSP